MFNIFVHVLHRPACVIFVAASCVTAMYRILIHFAITNAMNLPNQTVYYYILVFLEVAMILLTVIILDDCCRFSWI